MLGQIALGMLLLGTVPARTGERDAAAPKSREFLFTYAATVTGLKPGELARIWLPVPQSNAYQEVRTVAKKLPGQARSGKEAKFGNQILFVEGRADAEGTVPVAITYRVKRREVKGDASSPRLTKEEIELFLRPDARVPVGGKPAATLLKDRKLPQDQMRLARLLYDVVNNHMQYSKKGTGWGLGDAVWACDSRYGNCTDFHSLFISLARTEKIPAKFEIGFLLPEKRGKGAVAGYHCWAWFEPQGRGWIPVDISEANQARTTQPELVTYCFGNLTENRVAFSTGRDLMLVPPQAGPPVNFFIYPYVEVEGRPYPAERVQRRFAYRDVE
jgi:transglutaminase-like putative cysteine protease